MAGIGRANNVKSKHQHELDGTFRKDRHADLKTPEPTPGQPEPPAELDSIGQGEWDRLMWSFEDMGMLHKVDAHAAYQHCRLFAETEAVRQQQDEARAGLRVLEDNLADIQSADKVQVFSEIVALHKVISKCTDQLRSGRMAIRQYLVEFGLTPSARSRIKLPSRREEVDEFAAFQQAKPTLVK